MSGGRSEVLDAIERGFRCPQCRIEGTLSPHLTVASWVACNACLCTSSWQYLASPVETTDR